MLHVACYFLTSRSQRRHGQDKTVLSCPCRRCELKWRQVKTVFSNLRYIWDWTFLSSPAVRHRRKLQKLNMLSFEIFCLSQSWLVFSSVHTADTDKTRQDSFVLSVKAVWTSDRALFVCHRDQCRWIQREIAGSSADAVEKSRCKTCWRQHTGLAALLHKMWRTGWLLLSQLQPRCFSPVTVNHQLTSSVCSLWWQNCRFYCALKN